MNAKKFSFTLIMSLAILIVSCAQPAPPTVVQTMEVIKTVAVTTPTASPLPSISEFGKYQGYSEARYSETVKSSQYIPVRDGTRLAADIYRPAENGEVVATPLPVIWMFARYNRDQIEYLFQWIKTLVLSGYVIASVDVRGSGASFGHTQPGWIQPQESQDAYDVTEWLASQPWSDGNIGMMGGSYMGKTQLQAASAQPPHLMAIVPENTSFEYYTFSHPGGIFYDPFIKFWQTSVEELDASGKPVDEDKDGSMLAAAKTDHQANANMYNLYLATPYQDSQDPQTGVRGYMVQDLGSYLKGIDASQVAVYNRGGWYDLFSRDTLLWYNNLDNPRKIVMGPWSHYDLDTTEMMFEHLRWFDYWLKGIDNGIMQEPPIRYYTMGAREGWHTADAWPLPNQLPTSYYFSNGPGGSINSVNDGILIPNAPIDTSAIDVYQVDYSTSQGEVARAYADSKPLHMKNQMTNEQKGLTYTTEPLDSVLEVTGHPILHLWVTSSAPDGDFFVYLTDVAEDGRSFYVTEGKLRASHRALSAAPYDNFGLPYHRSYEADIADLPGEPVELVFDLLPTSYVFDTDHRIRVTIVGADKDNFSTPVLDPPPTVNIYRDAEHASYIELPVIP